MATGTAHPIAAMAGDYKPQPGDLYAPLEDGTVVFVPPERQLTCWRAPNPFELQRRPPVGKGPGALRRALTQRKARKS